MHHYHLINCIHCQGEYLQKYGKNPSGNQRYKCKSCKKYFAENYKYNACKSGVKDQIDALTVNNSGTRDIGRVLKISKEWYLLDCHTGNILGWENGRRKNNVLKYLLNAVRHIPIKIGYTDDWDAYQQVVGKDNTWKIERRNLNFRTHIKRLNRKVICFSKNEQIHDNVIGMYIEKYYFQQSIFNNAS